MHDDFETRTVTVYVEVLANSDDEAFDLVFEECEYMAGLDNAVVSVRVDRVL